MARIIDLIVIHCSDSPNGKSLFTGSPSKPGFITPVMEIDRWHKERGFKRLPNWRSRQNPELSSIGYHFVVYTRGVVATGRHLDEVGAHVEGRNANSIGICLIGRDQFSREQWESLKALVDGLKRSYPNARVVGHCDLNAAKSCPNFNVAEWLRTSLPLANRIYNPEPGVIA